MTASSQHRDIPSQRKPLSSRSIPIALIVVSALLLTAGTSIDSPSSAVRELDHKEDSFRRSHLLQRFDRDQDGKLSAQEVSKLRGAFGEIDVPMLPDDPFDYNSAALDAHALAEFESADNSPAENPLTNAGVALGRVLFYDRQLSRNNTIACASCHHQRVAFADPRPVSVGFEGGRTSRNAMGLANLRFSNLRGRQPGFFWDERAPTLEEQSLMPIQDPIEMGMELSALQGKLEKLPYYPPLFEAAFGSPRVSSERISRAIAQFLRSLVSTNSKFDRAARALAPADTGSPDYAVDFAEFTAQENLGKLIFMNGVGDVAEFGCAFCHIPPTFNMPLAMNNGLELQSKDRGLGALKRPPNDPLTPSNDGKFKAPSLRNIALTAPYMHDGRFKSLEEVVEHYSAGIRPHENLGLAFDEMDREKGTSGFKFNAEQKAALVEFLKTLTDLEFTRDPKFSDPFVRVQPLER